MTTATVAGSVARNERMEQFVYDDAIVRLFLLATLVWGLVGMLVGIVIALELAQENLAYEDMASKFFEHFIAIADHQVGARGHEVAFANAARGVTNLDGGLVFFVAGREGHDELRQSGDFVHLFFDGDAGLQILELDAAADLGENREGVGIPFSQGLADGNRLALFDAEARAAAAAPARGRRVHHAQRETPRRESASRQSSLSANQRVRPRARTPDQEHQQSPPVRERSQE